MENISNNRNEVIQPIQPTEPTRISMDDLRYHCVGKFLFLRYLRNCQENNIDQMLSDDEWDLVPNSLVIPFCEHLPEPWLLGFFIPQTEENWFKQLHWYTEKLLDLSEFMFRRCLPVVSKILEHTYIYKDFNKLFDRFDDELIKPTCLEILKMADSVDTSSMGEIDLHIIGEWKKHLKDTYDDPEGEMERDTAAVFNVIEQELRAN